MALPGDGGYTDPSQSAAPPPAVPAPTPYSPGSQPATGFPEMGGANPITGNPATGMGSPAPVSAQPPYVPSSNGVGGGGGGAPPGGIDWNTILTNPDQLKLQKAYQDWYMQTYFPQMYQLQQQMQNAQINMGNYNADWQGILGQANMMGSMNGQVTFPAQTMMNQMALQQGNQNLTARGQNAAYDQALMNLASNTGAQDTSYALGGMNLAGQTGAQNAGIIQGGQNLAAQTGQQDVQMANIQAQLAQSPLVAWYTARGLPPPQSAIMTAQAPDLAQQLSTLNQYMPAAPNLTNQFQNVQQYMPAAPNFGQQTGQIPQLGQFTPPQMSWNFQNTAPAVPSLPIQGGGPAYQYPSSPQPINQPIPSPGGY